MPANANGHLPGHQLKALHASALDVLHVVVTQDKVNLPVESVHDVIPIARVPHAEIYGRGRHLGQRLLLGSGQKLRGKRPGRKYWHVHRHKGIKQGVIHMVGCLAFPFFRNGNGELVVLPQIASRFGLSAPAEDFVDPLFPLRLVAEHFCQKHLCFL